MWDKMTKVEMDSRGRIVIPKKYRTEEKEYRVVRFEGSIRLIPVPEDPIEDLRERTKSVREDDRSAKELQEEAREALKEQAGE